MRSFMMMLGIRNLCHARNSHDRYLAYRMLCVELFLWMQYGG